VYPLLFVVSFLRSKLLSYTSFGVQSLRGHTQRMMAENSEPAAQAVSGKEWVRGWDDWKKEGTAEGPAAAEQPASS